MLCTSMVTAYIEPAVIVFVILLFPSFVWNTMLKLLSGVICTAYDGVVNISPYPEMISSSASVAAS